MSDAPPQALAALPPLAAITLDATGTLFHSPRLGEIYAEVLARHGVALEPGEAAGLLRQVWQELDCLAHPERDRFASHPEGERGWWRRLLERFGEYLGVAVSPFAAAELFDRFARADAWEPYPEVGEVLAELEARGYQLAVVSNWDSRLPRVLDGLGLGPRFRAIVYSAGVGVEKPHPAIFRAALEALGQPAAAVLHVGDRRRHDLEGAQAVGMPALHLDRGGGDPGRPEVVSIRDLRPLLQLPPAAPGPP